MRKRCPLLLVLIALVLPPRSGAAAPGDSLDALASLQGPENDIPTAEIDRLASWIDRVFERAWERSGIEPARAAAPSTFLRRAFLDIAGRLPSPEITERFLAEPFAAAKKRLIDELVTNDSSPFGTYARNFANLWSVLLVGRGYLPDDKHREPFVEWLERQFGANVPHDRWVSALLTSVKTNTREVSPTVFLASQQSNAAANTTKITSRFLGLDLQCAQCHDHPYQKWTQEDFHGVAAFFARQRERDVGGNVYELFDAEDGEARYQTPAGEDRTAAMRYPDGSGFTDPQLQVLKMTRREMFARRLTGDPRFALAQVNRAWAHLMGRGLVEPLDGFGDDARRAVPLVLDLLARKFKESGFDNRWLIRVLARTRVYGLASEPARLPAGAAERLAEESFASFPVKALTGEQVFDAVLVASRLVEALAGEQDHGSPEGDAPKTARLRREMQEEFLEAYAWEPEEVIDPREGTLPQALALLNGRLTAEASAARPRSSVAESLALEPAARAEFLYRSALVRGPSPEEKERAVAFLAGAANPAAAAGDLLWTLINSSEFRYNH